MNTVADKLMKLVQTKSDIRQALLDKGFNVPDTMPFSGYADLIRRFPCNAKDFPDIPGMIARWSAKGLTNEDMSTNPVWKDLMGNGYDLQMKNFLWGGMSGVGGYKLNWGDSSIWVNYITQGARGTGEVTDNTIHITSAKSNNALFETRASLKSVEYKVLIKGLTDDIYLRYGVSNDGKELWTEIKNDGIYTLPSYDYDSKFNMKWKVMSQTYPIDCNITIEQLPLYPGAIVFDGVDDYGICENFPILTKEKGYTVVALRQFLGSRDSFLISNRVTGTAFSNGAFIFERFWEKSGAIFYNFGTPSDQLSLKPYSPFSYLTSKSYNGRATNAGDAVPSNTLLVGKSIINDSNSTNAAIWEICILDHDATEEELQKIQDYYKQEYPWLFPDQAWTVVGKTNEDTDRATIANITGNGNNLVLSNLGFIEGSGYNEEGEYAGYLVTDGVDDKIQSSNFPMGKDFTVVGEWKLLSVSNYNYAGIVKSNNLYVYNSSTGINIYVCSSSAGNKMEGLKSLKAICSDGRVYDDNWVEYKLKNVGDNIGANSTLDIGTNKNNFTKIAFKNLEIYNNKILSKEDCIKAYNYLQTLKS